MSDSKCYSAAEKSVQELIREYGFDPRLEGYVGTIEAHVKAANAEQQQRIKKLEAALRGLVASRDSWEYHSLYLLWECRYCIAQHRNRSDIEHSNHCPLGQAVSALAQVEKPEAKSLPVCPDQPLVIAEVLARKDNYSLYGDGVQVEKKESES